MINFTVTFPENNELEKAMLNGLKESYTQRLSKVQCSEHLQYPEIIISGSVTDPKIEIKGCCQKLIDDELKALS